MHLVCTQCMQKATWSDGTSAVRSARTLSPPSELSSYLPAQVTSAADPAAETGPPARDAPPTDPVHADPVHTALETRPGWRPEQFPGTGGRCRESSNERLGARAPVPGKTANPFLAGSHYLDGLALQDAFLTPKSSHGAGAFEST